jgi:hypothetical protein
MTQHALITLTQGTARRLTPPGIHSGRDFTIQNVNATGYVYVGGEGVSITNYGYRILPNHAISFELAPKDTMYAISYDSGAKIAVIDIGLE